MLKPELSSPHSSVGFYLNLLLMYLSTASHLPRKRCCHLFVWDHILRQLPQSLFAKLVAGPAGRPAKACLQPSFLQDTLAHQTNTNQTRNEHLPKTSFQGIWRTSTSWRKMRLDTDALPGLLEPGLRKKHMHRTGGTWGTCHCLGNNLPEHLIQGCATKWRGDPHHWRTQELRTDGTPLDTRWWLSLETLSRLLARFLSFLSFFLFPVTVSLCLHLNRWLMNLFDCRHLTSFVS